MKRSTETSLVSIASMLLIVWIVFVGVGMTLLIRDVVRSFETLVEQAQAAGQHEGEE